MNCDILAAVLIVVLEVLAVLIVVFGVVVAVKFILISLENEE